MRCSCRVCGTYMIQEEYGLQSGCKCPNCGEMCHDCMGSAREPLGKEELAGYFAFQIAALRENEAQTDDPAQEQHEKGAAWRKYL